MSYVDEQLERGEIITYRMNKSKIAYFNAILILCGIMTPHFLSRLATSEFALTDRRIIARSGMFRRKELCVAYKHVQSVRVSQGLLGRLFDYGTVTLVTIDGRNVSVYGVCFPYELQQLAEEAVEKAVLGTTLSDYATPKE